MHVRVVVDYVRGIGNSEVVGYMDTLHKLLKNRERSSPNLSNQISDGASKSQRRHLKTGFSDT